MNLKYALFLGLVAASAASQSFANEVLLTTDKPLNITYQIAHKKTGGETVLGERQNVRVESNYPITIPLENYDLTGVVIDNVEGHELPANINQFDKPEQCSMTTNKIKSSGALSISLDKHTLKCKTFGGVYGN